MKHAWKEEFGDWYWQDQEGNTTAMYSVRRASEPGKYVVVIKGQSQKKLYTDLKAAKKLVEAAIEKQWPSILDLPRWDELREYVFKLPTGKKETYLATPDGPVRLEAKLGKGQFSTVFRAGKTAYIFTNSSDKEAVAEAYQAARGTPAAKHLPALERVGNLAKAPGPQVYRSPIYRAPLRKAEAPKAFETLRKLAKAHDKGYANSLRSGRREHYEVNADVVEEAEKQGVQSSVLQALRELEDAAGNYGLSFDDFKARNSASPEGEDTYIFLDPLFDKREMDRRRFAARRRY